MTAQRGMPPWWRLAISNLLARRGRTALLVGCVALCAALVVAIRCSIASLNEGLNQRVLAAVGAADVRIVNPAKVGFDLEVVRAARAWPEAKLVAPRLVDGLALSLGKEGGPARSIRVIAYGVDPVAEGALRPLKLSAGRWLMAGTPPKGAPGEVVLDQRVAEQLHASVGDVLEVQRFGSPVRLVVVGIAQPPALSGLFKNILPVYGDIAVIGAAVDRPGEVNEVDVLLARGRSAEQVVSDRRAALPKGLLLQPTEKITSGYYARQRGGDSTLTLASILAFLASAFIITTGMTSAVGERLRELAILRAVGATRGQLAAGELLTGAIVGLLGACVGVPAGIIGSWVLVKMFPEQLPAGFVLSLSGVAAGVVGSVLAGMGGAGYAAWAASRVSPMAGLASRARPVRGRTIVICLLAGATLVMVQALIVLHRPSDPSGFFWLYAPIGAPSLLTGYFLLSIPVTFAASWLLGGVVARVLGVPGVLLTRGLMRTPVRSGLTAGSMMLGLALMVSIWTNGRGILDRWFEGVQFPDAFVTGLNLKPDLAERIRQVPGVQGATAITLLNVGTDAFGIEGLTKYRTTFLAFEPEPFFAMTKLQWLQGDVATASAALQAGGAVLVAREFMVTRGMGLGDKITLTHNGVGHDFTIVGVVTSPGLDIASKFFDIGENYVDQAVNSVFGTRADLRSRFGSEAINLVQIAFTPGGNAEETMRAIRNLPGTGILAGGTAVAMKAEIRGTIQGALRVFALVAIGAMLVACLGVANVIIASVRGRSFEFGVIRASGGSRGMLARLILGEGLLIALAAAILGTALGLQGAWGGQNVTASSIGIELPIRPPWDAIGWSVLTVTAITLLAAMPAALGLLRRQPRELLAAMRG